MNTQQVRLIDVFVIAPVLIYAGTRKEITPALKTTLIIIGAATLLYNGINYINEYNSKQQPTER